MGGCKFKEQLVHHYACHGEWFVLMVGINGEGTNLNPVALQVIDPMTLTVERADAFDQPMLWKWRKKTAKGYIEVMIDDDHLIRYNSTNIHSQYRGQGVLDTLAESLDSEFIIRNHNMMMQKHGGALKGVLSISGDRMPHQEEVDRFKKEWNRNYKSYKGAGKDAVLTGDWKYQQLGMNAKDLDYFNATKITITEIASAFGVPKVIMGEDDNGTYNNFAEARRIVWQDTIIPMFRKAIIEPFLMKLGHMDETVMLELDLSNVPALTEDRSQKVDDFSKLVASGISREQANVITGLNAEIDAESADTEYLPSGLIEVSTSEPSEESAEVTARVDATLNGAQITSLVKIVQDVASGLLPKQTAVEIILASFPFDRTRAEQILSDIDEGSQEEPPQAPQTPQDGAQQLSLSKLTCDCGACSGVNKEHLNDEPSQEFTRVEMDEETKQARDIIMKNISIGRDDMEARMRSRLQKFFNDQRVRVLKSFGKFAEDELPIIQASFSGGVTKAQEPTPEELDYADAVFSLEFEQEELRALTRPILANALGVALEQVIKEIGASEEDFNRDVFIEAQLQQQVLMRKINETTRDKLALAFRAVNEGLEQGLAFDEIVENVEGNLKNVYKEADRSSARKIARTEIGRSFTATRFEAFKEAGVSRIQWLSSRDEVVRDDHEHLDMDGITVTLGESFLVNQTLRYPKDPLAPASQTINCRCEVISADII
jgi:HK97 family phage portal protein